MNWQRWSSTVEEQNQQGGTPRRMRNNFKDNGEHREVRWDWDEGGSATRMRVSKVLMKGWSGSITRETR